MSDLGPEIPALGDFGVALTDYLTSLLLRGLLAVWTVTIGWMLVGKDGNGGLAGFLNFSWSIFGKHVGFDFGGPIRALNTAFVKFVGKQATYSDEQAGKFYHAGAALTVWTAREIQNTTDDVLSWGKWVVHVFVPTHTQAVTHHWITLGEANAKEITRLNAQAAALAHGAPAAARYAGRTAAPAASIPYPREWEWIHTHWKELVATVAGGIAIPGAIELPRIHLPKWIGRTWKQVRDHERRLRKVEGLFGAAGIAAVMANALGLPNWRCITRGNLGRVSRALCGIPTSLLNDLLGLIADFFILENICTVLPWLEAAASDIGVPLVNLLTDVGAGLCAGSIGAPDPLQGAAVTVPPVYGGELSFAV